MSEGKAIVLQGNALALPLPDESVDLIITSPPYFALRSYRDDGEHYTGQIGSEETPQLFLEALWKATEEMVRVLKPTGSIWLNLGDKFAGSGGHNNSNVASRGAFFPTPNDGRKTHRKAGERVAKGEAERAIAATRRNAPDSYNKNSDGIPAKSLMLLPHRYAIGCIDRLGLIVRQDQVWSKPNCLSGGTYVYAKIKGRPTSIKVHDLCRAYQPNDVQLWNGDKWTQVVWWQPTDRHPNAEDSYKAIRAARKRGDEPVVNGDIELEFQNGVRVGCTREHRWPTRRGLVLASDLEVGDVLDATRLPDGATYPEALDDEMVGWFVGLYIAEGSQSGTTIQIAGHVDELERYKRLKTLAEAFHGNCAAHATGGNAATINLTGRFLDAILDTYVGGRTAKDKHLAPKAWQRSNRFLRAVLDGYLSGDGHYELKTDRWVLGFTDNDYLASDLRTIGARLGLSVRLRRCTHTGYGKEWPGWNGSIVFDPGRRRQSDTRIVAIRQSRARRFWDIGVADEPHLFALASGVLTHNSLPESVTDRTRRSHEFWFHMVKSPRYFAAVDEIREPAATAGMEIRSSDGYPTWSSNEGNRHRKLNRDPDSFNPLGKLPSSVWSIPSEPLLIPAWAKEKYNLPDHFAAFPTEWPRRLILGWSPSGICVECGEGRRPITARQHTGNRRGRQWNVLEGGPDGSTSKLGWESETTITGYACACGEVLDAGLGTKMPPTTSSIILDPFGGTGTVALVARALGRVGISVDLSHDYSRLAKWRIEESGHAAKAIRKTNQERQGAML